MPPERAYRHLFGPVPSRRFGRSLGIDLVPAKTCSFDCVFCQAGKTTAHVLERKEYVPLADVVREFGDWLASGGTADVVTLSGSGEPTLHTGFGEVLAAVQRGCDIKRVLLTNGSLLWDPAVRAAACGADVVKVSLSAWDDASLRRVNRPHPELTFDRMVEGIRAFRGAFAGEMWCEVFVLAHENDNPAAMQRIADILKTIRPDRIHLNTVVRPPAEPTAEPATPSCLDELAGVFEPRAEIIAGFRAGAAAPLPAGALEIRAMVGRRPCTEEDIANAFGMHPLEVVKHLSVLLSAGQIRRERRGDAVYYRSS